MSLKKLWTALVGATNEGLEAAADTQAIRILEQELREAKEELRRSDQSLTSIMAKRKLTSNKVTAFQADIDKYSEHAVSASESGNMELAVECAERVADLESQMAMEQSILDGF